MRIVQAILLLVVISTSGCDMLHVKQYQVEGVTEGSSDAGKLKAILENVADKTGMAVSTKTNVFASYSSTNMNTVTSLDAWLYDDDARIQLCGGYGTPPAYKQANRLLLSALSTEFGAQFSTPARRFSQVQSIEQKN
jgi:hypothetical protein